MPVRLRPAREPEINGGGARMTLVGARQGALQAVLQGGTYHPLRSRYW